MWSRNFYQLRRWGGSLSLFNFPHETKQETCYTSHLLPLLILTISDVLFMDSDILVPITATLLVPPTQGMDQLVKDHTPSLAPNANRELLDASFTPNIGSTPKISIKY